MGNSTRVYSVIQVLHRRGYRIEVATSNNGLLFFEGKAEVAKVHPIGAVQYGKNKKNQLTVLRTFWLVLTSLKLFCRNGWTLTKLVRELRPLALVYDSQYNLLPLWLTRTPLIALNNADRIVERFFRLRRKPFSIFPQFFLVEMMDWLFHRFVPGLTLSPWVEKQGPRRAYQAVGLIVRRGIRAVPRSERPNRILIMLSGSIFGGNLDPTAWGLPQEFDVVGREGRSSERVRFHGKLVDNIPLLLAADVLIINAGFSAVCEAIALRKPTVVIPVEKHAEQWVNARTIEDLGLGRMASASTVREILGEVIQNYEMYSRRANELAIACEGAGECAEAMIRFASRRRPEKSYAAEAMSGQKIIAE